MFRRIKNVYTLVSIQMQKGNEVKIDRLQNNDKLHILSGYLVFYYHDRVSNTIKYDHRSKVFFVFTSGNYN